MSEAMSSVEIEDVLSSIRRLVSEDLRPGNRGAAAKKPDEKLILTPAFRVVAEVAPSVASVDPAPPKTSLPRLHLGASPVIEDLAAKLERAVEAQDVEWESETGDPQPMVAQMEWTETGWAPVAPAAAPQPEPVPSWAQTDVEDLADALDDPPPSQAIVEPDAHWADMAEAEAMAELRDEIAEDAPFAADVRPEVTFDEQVLRDLVRDLIREELQGSLGERITRNVRKLVHAEIARALAAQDFE